MQHLHAEVKAEADEAIATMKAASLAAYQAVFCDLEHLVTAGKLPDDLSLLILAKLDQLPLEIGELISRQVSTTKAGWFDTHPADQDRIRRAYREQATAIFADPRSATALFIDFKALSRNTTWDLYRACFGSRFQPSRMQSVEEIARAEAAAQEPLPPIPFD